MNHSEKNKIVEEINRLTAQLEREPDNMNYLEKRGDLHYQAGNLGKAINDYQHILQLKPDRKNIRTKIDLIRTILRYSNTDIYASPNTNMDPWLE